MLAQHSAQHLGQIRGLLMRRLGACRNGAFMLPRRCGAVAQRINVGHAGAQMVVHHELIETVDSKAQIRIGISRLDASSPDDHVGRDVARRGDQQPLAQLLHPRVGQHVHLLAPKRHRGLLGNTRRQAAQNAVAPFHQRDVEPKTLAAAQALQQGRMGLQQFGRQLHSGRPSAHDGDRERAIVGE
ncbi:hypothetical protein SDC9_171015 [bioreactor metagenome]|uniref:Uncharacterized protein n=1 Tax=bioreactor metagenome TaxID=1076179 RepID=A0A645GCB0_9ZZZZ